jgi:precorrin-6Y C5,15-methyltransferase (decarboxylating)
MNKIELLAPAGDLEKLKIAVLYGADAVFIGGHGGHLKEIMAKVLTVLAPDGIIVMNSVKAPKVLTDSHQLWDEACSELGLTQDTPTKIILNDNHPIEILRCKR